MTEEQEEMQRQERNFDRRILEKQEEDYHAEIAQREAEERDYLVSQISALFPIDSDYPDTCEVGRRLLSESLSESGQDWRSLPIETLRIYAQKCIDEDARQAGDFEKVRTA